MPTWRYSYKTSDGIRHEGTIRAVSRDGVYGELRRQGIKPIKVELAPGRLNRLLALGKRGWTILFLALLALGLTAALWEKRTEVKSVAVETISPRHPVEGLPLDWTRHLESHWGPAKAFLALFAQPGRTEFEAEGDASAFTEEGLRRENGAIGGDVPQWVREMDGILSGMSEEAMALFRMGKRPEDVILWLRERQRMEASYRQQILEGSGTVEEKRQRLKAMGL